MMAWEDECGLTSDIPEEKAVKKKQLKSPHLAHTARVSKTGKPVAPYEETLHPRGLRGQFIEKPGGGEKDKEESPDERQTRRHTGQSAGHKRPPTEPKRSPTEHADRRGEKQHFHEHKQVSEQKRSESEQAKESRARPEPTEAIKNVVAKGGTVSKAEHVFAKGVEQRISRKLSAKWLSDNEPVDAALIAEGKEHGIEIKSLPKGSKQAITMHDDARLRKVEYAAENPNREVHTVAYDGRNEYAGGKFRANYSGHTLYYRRGAGAYSLNSMHKVKDFEELSQLIKTPYDQLPEKAKGRLPTGDAVAKLRDAAERAHASRLRKDRALKQRKKSQGEQPS